MRRVEAPGIRRTLSWEDFSKNPALLIALIESVIKEKSFYQNASKFKNILSAYDAAKTATDIIISS